MSQLKPMRKGSVVMAVVRVSDFRVFIFSDSFSVGLMLGSSLFRHSNHTKYGGKGRCSEIDATLCWLPDAPNEHVQEEDDGDWEGHIVEHLSDYGSVGEDAEEDLDKDEGDDSYGVHHFLALVGVAGIL